MTNTNHEYGTSVVEFFKHDEAQLEKLTKDKEVAYFRHSESPAYPQLGAHVDWFSEKPIHLALIDLTGWLLKGYTVATALTRPLYLKVQLRKPESMIDSDLKALVKQAASEYDKQRYARNIEETQRQIEFTMARKVREAEAEAAKAAAGLLESAQRDALADLVNAYKEPSRPKLKKTAEASE